jgi:hypothetical protein
VPVQFVANEPGTASVTVTINYLDDFQQPQKATYTLTVEVQDMPTPMPETEGGNQGNNPEGELGILDRILRAVLGFFGLSTRDSNVGGGVIIEGGPNGGGGGGRGGGGGSGGNGGVAGG